MVEDGTAIIKAWIVVGREEAVDGEGEKKKGRQDQGHGGLCLGEQAILWGWGDRHLLIAAEDSSGEL